MNAGSVTKRKWRIRLAGVMSAVLAAGRTPPRVEAEATGRV